MLKNKQKLSEDMVKSCLSTKFGINLLVSF